MGCSRRRIPGLSELWTLLHHGVDVWLEDNFFCLLNLFTLYRTMLDRLFITSSTIVSPELVGKVTSPWLVTQFGK